MWSAEARGNLTRVALTITEDDGLVLRSRSLGNLVLGVTRVFVDTHSASLGSVGILSGHVLSVGRPKDIESMSVIGSDNDQGLIELSDLFEVLDGLTDCVVKLEEFTESTVIVHGVEHFVNGSGLGEQQETLVTRSSVEDVDSLQGHLGQSGLVDSSSVTGRALGNVGQVLGEDFTIDPLGHVGLGEETERSLVGVKSGQGVLVVGYLVSSIGKDLVVVGLVGGTAPGDPLLGTTSEEDIGAGPLSPVRVVGGDTLEVLNGDRGVLASLKDERTA